MTKYYCEKCQRITSETKDEVLIKNKLCVICGQSTVPSRSIHNIGLKEIVKYQGQIWKIHQNDSDDNPLYGKRHAHNYEQKLVLNLENGNIFSINNKLVAKLKLKELFKLKQKSRFFKEPL